MVVVRGAVQTIGSRPLQGYRHQGRPRQALKAHSEYEVEMNGEYKMAYKKMTQLYIGLLLERKPAVQAAVSEWLLRGGSGGRAAAIG